MILFHDSETVGLQGSAKLHQYAVDGGPVRMVPMFRGWENNEETRKELFKLLDLIDRPDTVYCGFNTAFDLFHLYRVKHRLLGYEYDSPERPVMPFRCRTLDLQVHAMQKSPLAPFAFNKGGARSVALVRRIPKVAMEFVSNLVCEHLKPIIPQSFGLKVGIHKQAKRDDLVTLSFQVDGRLSLKGLMKEYGLPTIALDDVWPLPEKGTEKAWLPYPDPQVHDPIEAQCDLILAQPEHDFYRYSKLDILYLKVLYEKLGHPEPDYNSELCHNMAYTRYYGFAVDKAALADAERFYGDKVSFIEHQIQGINLRSSKDRLELLKPYFPLLASTKKSVLKHLAANETGRGAELAEAMVEYGPSRQRLLQIQKVAECRTGRAHPDLRVMGTPTNRMAGTSGLNWQGIGAVDEYEIDTEIDEMDELPEELVEAWNSADDYDKQKVGLRHAILTPCVGDWSSFEVMIANAVYNDPQLNEDLKNGVDLHSMGTVNWHPMIKKLGVSYEEFKEGYENNVRWDKARKGIKAVIFGSFYFCTAHAVSNALGILESEAQTILDGLYDRYRGMKRYRAAIEADFLTADPGRWSGDSVKRMKRSMVDLTGFERHWNFEAAVAELMWELGNSKKIRTGIGGKIVRNVTKGPQSIDMAVTSACLGSAIAIQAAVSRQAGNFKIQCTGATLNKKLQAELWTRLRVPTLQIHDELVSCDHPHFNFDSYSSIVDAFTEKTREIVPMVKFKYGKTERWSDK